MVVIRATSKLLDRLDVVPEDRPGASTGMLGDWFATMLQVRRGRFVLAISRITLLPVVVLGRDLKTLPNRLAAATVEMLSSLGAGPEVAERERLAMIDACYARTDDRSTVGVLTDLQRLLRFDLDDRSESTLQELSLRLAQTPIVARGLFPD